MKKSIFIHILVIIFLFSSFLQAGTKEELQRLQQDIATLQDQFRVFEETLDEYNAGLAGIKSLVEQLNDQVAKSNMILDKVSAAFEQQISGDRSKEDEILRVIQALSNKTDEMSMSISALARQVSDLGIQSAPINTSVSPETSSADILFNQAYYNFVEGNYDLAISGYNEYLTQFPSGEKATEARYNIGEAYFYTERFPEAIAAFTQVIDEKADSDKVAISLYKRGKSFLGSQNKDKAIEDFKTLIKRFPDAPEAALAKAELQDLGAAGKP